jgi:hypothetical protein
MAMSISRQSSLRSSVPRNVATIPANIGSTRLFFFGDAAALDAVRFVAFAGAMAEAD